MNSNETKEIKPHYFIKSNPLFDESFNKRVSNIFYGPVRFEKPEFATHISSRKGDVRWYISIKSDKMSICIDENGYDLCKQIIDKYLKSMYDRLIYRKNDSSGQEEIHLYIINSKSFHHALDVNHAYLKIDPRTIRLEKSIFGDNQDSYKMIFKGIIYQGESIDKMIDRDVIIINDN